MVRRRRRRVWVSPTSTQGNKEDGGKMIQQPLWKRIGPGLVFCCAVTLLLAFMAIACVPALLLLQQVHKSDKYECPEDLMKHTQWEMDEIGARARRDGEGAEASGGSASPRCFTVAAGKGRNDTSQAHKVCLREALARLQSGQAYLPSMLIVGPAESVATQLSQVLHYHPRLLKGEWENPRGAGGAASPTSESGGSGTGGGGAGHAFWMFPSTFQKLSRGRVDYFNGFGSSAIFATELVTGYVERFQKAHAVYQAGAGSKADALSALRFFDSTTEYAHDARAPYRLHATLPVNAAVVLTITDPFRQSCDGLALPPPKPPNARGGGSGSLEDGEVIKAIQDFKNRLGSEIDDVREYRACRGRALLSYLYPSCIEYLAKPSATVWSSRKEAQLWIAGCTAGIVCPYPIEVQVPDLDKSSKVSYASNQDDFYLDEKEIEASWASLEDALSSHLYRYHGGLPGWDPYEEPDRSGHNRVWSFADRQGADEYASFSCAAQFARAANTTLFRGMQWDAVRRYRATFAPPPTYVPPAPDSNEDSIHKTIELPSTKKFVRPPSAPQPLKPLPPRVTVVSDFEMRGEPDIRRNTVSNIVKSPWDYSSTPPVDTIAAARVAGSLWGLIGLDPWMGLEALPDDLPSVADSSSGGDVTIDASDVTDELNRQSKSKSAHHRQLQQFDRDTTIHRRAVAAAEGAISTMPLSCARLLLAAAEVAPSSASGVDPESLVFEAMAAVREIENFFQDTKANIAMVMDHPPAWTREYFQYSRMNPYMNPAGGSPFGSAGGGGGFNQDLPPLPPLPPS